MAALQKEEIETKLQARLQSLSHTAKSTMLQNDSTKTWLKDQLSLINVPKTMLDVCIEILEHMSDLKVVWLHLQECTGCSESLLRTEAPSFEVLLFDIFKIVYHDLVMVSSGHGATAALEYASSHEKYVLLVEGSVPMGFAKDYITLGNRNGYDEVSHLLHNAEAVFAVGTCSSFGGIQSAYPNPTNGHALSEIFEREVINIPGCPPSDKNIVATLLYYYLFGESPSLDSLKRPLWAYGKSVHDLCERKSFFMSGDFVESFDDPNMKEGYCLYKVGCKGPYTYNNCPKVKFNAKTSWPVQGGHGCIGCSEPNFWDNFGNIEKPLSNKSFFTLNEKFVPKILPLSYKKLQAPIQNTQEYMQFANTLKSTKNLFINLGVDESSVVLYEDGECKPLISCAISLNPKLVLQSYESKNKQGKKLYANYQNKMKDRYIELMKLCDKERISSNINDAFSLFAMILDDKTLIDEEINMINMWLESSLNPLGGNFQTTHILQLAKSFKFPHVSELGFKFKKDNDYYMLDYAKALSIAMSYRIGGLDMHGLAYSMACDLANAFVEIIDTTCDTIVLQGEMFNLSFIQQIFTRRLKDKTIVVLTY
ncbi:hydrogenase small subunit [Helicobacter trogontum]|uniref:Hydrogenase (NiFe) small subunit n=1 Tax=Helicobacter trogontum TaxID=50960 RepID=A0A4U8SEV1_9HELI|nr:hydrogenase small subunit [Helicobacter trogontum]TLD84728.1 hydrogenase (NiFe) small subunit [Helicobacter trogontum]